MLDFKRIEEKWRRRWEESKVFESDPDPRPKYYITVAYPYPNSPQHVGHGRTYTIADVHARYKRMQGYNVLFPMAFHYTGTPILAMARRVAEGDEELIRTFTKIYHVPRDKVMEFGDPLAMARYFHEEIKEGMKEMGYSIDWRREFTTIDPEYSKFIEWQFRTLRAKGYISQGTHPVGWCPKDMSPVGQHDTLGDKEPEIVEYTMIKFRLGDFVLPTATLRPETVYGVTNIWVDPDAEYYIARVGGELWIVSPRCFEKLKHLEFGPSKEGEVSGKELVGKQAMNPVNGSKVPVLPAKFLDPNEGSGIVMSVPAHAPYDYQALKDIGSDLEPIPIIETEGYSELPARDVVEKFGVKDQKDERLKEATKELYLAEFSKGRMKGNTPFPGMKVKEARELVKSRLLEAGDAVRFYEIANKPVICRCGTEVLVKIFRNQWFINYGDAGWKELAKECLSKMKIVPEEVRQEFRNTIDWLREKACARKFGLGTKLPWDREWIIESLSDSVIYMAYYTIVKELRRRGIRAEHLGDDVFDYVFLGKGDPSSIASKRGLKADDLEALRNEFLYYYPLDSRHSGRDLVPNHLTFFIFNHVAIFPKELWPRQIVVNGSVLMEGKKMSKSLGNILPLRDAIKRYGADSLRLAMLITAELLSDANFSLSTVKTMAERLTKLYNDAVRLKGLKATEPSSREDAWILSRLQRLVQRVTDSMERMRIREALHLILFDFEHELQWYERRRMSRPEVDPSMAATLKRIMDVRVRLLAPMAPFIYEEIWELLGGKGFISEAEWPRPDSSLIDERLEAEEELVQSLLEDTRSILSLLKKGKRLIYYTASDWKWRIYEEALSARKPDVGGLIRLAIDMGADGREAATYSKELVRSLSTMSDDERERRKRIGRIDEFGAISRALPYLEKELGLKVEVYREEDAAYDPENRARLSKPFRPAIYLEPEKG